MPESQSQLEPEVTIEEVKEGGTTFFRVWSTYEKESLAFSPQGMLFLLNWLEEHRDMLCEQIAVSELLEDALSIARAQRGEDHLQLPETIRAKFFQEMNEWQAVRGTDKAIEELVDLVYYAVQDYGVNGDIRDLHATMHYLSTESGYTVPQLYAAACAKYALRAKRGAGGKDFMLERQAIDKALASLSSKER